MNFKLGRKAVKHDSRRLMLAAYLPPEMPPAPPCRDWTKGIRDFGVMLNSELGCCTIAGIGHAVQIWTANSGSEVTIPDSTVLAYYENWDGYVVGDPSTDQGGIEESVLDSWRKSSFGGHILTAYADPNVKNINEVKQAINLFEGLYIGMTVTADAMENANDITIPWDQTGDTSSVGGHCVFVVGYDMTYIYFVSWGQLYKMTLAYWDANVDEAHALMSPDLLGSSGLSALGFNTSQLLADLSAIC